MLMSEAVTVFMMTCLNAIGKARTLSAYSWTKEKAIGICFCLQAYMMT